MEHSKCESVVQSGIELRNQVFWVMLWHWFSGSHISKECNVFMDVFHMLLCCCCRHCGSLGHVLSCCGVGVTDMCVANGACCVACDVVVVAMTPFVA